MAYFIIEDFKSGLDVRRSRFTSVPGTLQEIVDAHITRGGDIETRKAFVDKGSLRPPGQPETYGLDCDTTGLVVFGSEPEGGGLPTGVRYQRLVSPTGANMIGIAAATQFTGRMYVVANYDDGTQWHFYDGELVTDWGAGVVMPYMATNDDIAQHLVDLINARGVYTATRAGNVIEIEGGFNEDYAFSTSAVNVDGGADNQTLAFTILQAASGIVASARAIAEFAIVGGRAGAGNYIEKVRVDSAGFYTELIGANVMFTTSPEVTGTMVATAVNALTSVHGYSAASQYGKVYLYAPAGAAANGKILEVTAKGEVVMYVGGFAITTGTASPGVNTISSVKANGLEILGTTVDWFFSHEYVAEEIADEINSYASVPKYNAYHEGANVFISPETIRSDDATSIAIEVTVNGDTTGGPGSGPGVIPQYPDYPNPGGPRDLEP